MLGTFFKKASSRIGVAVFFLLVLFLQFLPLTLAYAADATGAPTASSGNPVSNFFSGLWSGVTHLAGNAGNALLSVTLVPLSYVIFMLCSWILGLVGVLFNWTIIRTVFEFGNYFGNSAGLLSAWGILRDVGNIMLLFGFIFMGVSTILDLPHSEFTAKRALPALIIFAILMNFSLFSAEAVIDVANGFSSVLAEQAGQSCSGQAVQDCENNGISGAIFRMTGGSSPFADPLSGSTAEPLLQIELYLTLALFSIVTAFVLLAGAIMLIARAVTLVFVIITSPVGFAGMAVPPLHELAKQWWHTLINQAFFAPVYLLLILISIKISDSLGHGGNIVTALVSGGADGLQVLLLFGVVIGFMLFSLIAAKRMGAAGAGFATSTAGALTVGAAAGTAAFVGRRTIGAGSSYAANRIASSKFARTNPNLARFAYGIANKGATSSFDARNSSLGKAASSATGFKFGTVNKDAAHGFHGIEEKAVKQRVEFGGKLKQSEAEKQREKDLGKKKTLIQNSKAGAEKNWTDEKKTLTENINQKTLQNAANEERRGIDLDAQKKKLDNAKNSTLLLSPEEKAKRIATEQKALDGLVTKHADEVKQEKADLGALQQNMTDRAAAHKNDLAGFDKEIGQIDTELRGGTIENEDGTKTEYGGITSTAIKTQYAKTLRGDEGDREGHGTGLRWPSVERHATHEAAEKILKEGGKSKTEVALDTLKSALDSSAAPAPAAHAPTPAAGGGGGHH